MIVRLEEDPETGDLMLPIPDTWLNALDWRAGDVMDWKMRPTGEWELTNRTKAERDQHARRAGPESPKEDTHDASS
jgi:hypothetical protein